MPDLEVTFLEAVEILLSGELLIYPTETFYALGASPFSKSGVSKLLQLKDRSLLQGLPLIVDSAERIESIIGVEVSGVREERLRLIETYWPGPLTLVIQPKKSFVDSLASGVCASDGSLALRCSSSKHACSLAGEAGGYIISSSANLRGESPIRTAKEAVEKFPDLPVYRSEELASEAFAPSTIIDVRSLPNRLIRKGAVAIKSFGVG